MYGALAHLGLTKEVTWGTPVAASAYLPFESEGITHDIEQIVDPSIKAILDESPSYGGLEKFNGDISFLVRPTTIGHILRAALGAPSTSGVGPYTHVFLPAQAEFSSACFLPPYTLEVNRDLGAANAFQFTGCSVNSLKLDYGTKQKMLKAVAGIIAKDVTNIAKTTPSFETFAPFLWNEAVLKIATVANNEFEDFGISIDNKLEGIPTLNATKRIAKIQPNGFRTIEIDATVSVADLTEYNRFKNQTETAFEITFTSGANILKIELPKVRYTAFPVGVSGPDRLLVKVKGKAKYDVATLGAAKITLTNTTATY